MRKKQKDILSRIKGEYKGFRLEQIVTRQGSIDILKMPSRMGNTLFYPDGRKEKI